MSYIVFLHQTTTPHSSIWLMLILSYIVFLHQTTTVAFNGSITCYCLISSFYIKPQLYRCACHLLLIVLYRLSTSNHNDIPLRSCRWLIVLYRLSTSNHNWHHCALEHLVIVLYRLSTSNHNEWRTRETTAGLSYIVFLHQTTTAYGSIRGGEKLSYIVFLHQTTT